MSHLELRLLFAHSKHLIVVENQFADMAVTVKISLTRKKFEPLLVEMRMEDYVNTRKAYKVKISKFTPYFMDNLFQIIRFFRKLIMSEIVTYIEIVCT